MRRHPQSLPAVAALLFWAGALLAQQSLMVILRDLEGIPLEGFRVSYKGNPSGPTVGDGSTHLSIQDTIQPGEGLKIGLPADLAAEWFLIDPVVYVPKAEEDPPELVLMRRSDFRALADQVAQPGAIGDELSEQRRRDVVLAYASERGLSEAQLEAAIVTFGETASNAMDAGAAYVALEYSKAEPLFREALEVAEGGLSSIRLHYTA